MEGQETAEQTADLIRRYKWSLIVGIGGLLLLAAGFFVTRHDSSSKELEFTPSRVSDATQNSKATDIAEQVVVDVAGAVLRPGVYQMPKNARLQDVLAKAGGITSEAHTSYVAKSMNLAEHLTDGMKVYVPFQDEELVGVAGASTSNGKVSMNTATSSELEGLPAIGPQTATKIIKLRPYKTLDELVSKKAISKSVFDKIKLEISL